MLNQAWHLIGAFTTVKPKSPAMPAGSRSERVFSSQTAVTNEELREQEELREYQESQVQYGPWSANEWNEILAMRAQMDTVSTDEGLARLEQWQQEFDRAWGRSSSNTGDREPNTWMNRLKDRLKRVTGAIAKQFNQMLSSPNSSPSASRENSRATNGSQL